MSKKYLSKNEFPCQGAYNKISLDRTPSVLKIKKSKILQNKKF